MEKEIDLEKMSEKIIFEPTPEQFGIFWKYLSRPEVTDVDYNGKNYGSQI